MPNVETIVLKQEDLDAIHSLEDRQEAETTKLHRAHRKESEEFWDGIRSRYGIGEDMMRRIDSKIMVLRDATPEEASTCYLKMMRAL